MPESGEDTSCSLWDSLHCPTLNIVVVVVMFVHSFVVELISFPFFRSLSMASNTRTYQHSQILDGEIGTKKEHNASGAAGRYGRHSSFVGCLGT